ncbi:MAG TPA: phosphoglucosamine mutase [Nocardioidaceae bacterium]|nr:phosphoglucosamine mutase [Nocardioidaceae bacterium]
MSRIFGTDGVRGIANRELTVELALDVAIAAAHVLGETGTPDRYRSERPMAVVGRDPRASGEFLEAAVVAGLASAGVDVLRLGVLPTPAVAFLTADFGADFGVMLSASHNPMPDNGIKIFARGGHKLEDLLEQEIEAHVGAEWTRPTGRGVGRVRDLPAEADARYVDHLLSTVSHRLDGLKVVVDAANGAAHELAPRTLRAVGAEVVEIHCDPDGYDINADCGSTHPESLQAAVVDHRADAGVALDGDADRCLAVDAQGAVVDGDQILAVLALAMRDDGRLKDSTVVATVMSNLGFRLAMEREQIGVEQTKVGDRYVLELMRARGYTLGGEQSGHLVMTDHATTGDGVLTALHLLARMAETGRSLAELTAVMARLPQVLVNVPGVDRARTDSDETVRAAVREAEAELGDGGRVLLRPSGTEAVVRVMVEAQSAEQAERVAQRLAAVVQVALAL